MSATQLQEDSADIGCRVSGKAGFGDHGILQKAKVKGWGVKTGSCVHPAAAPLAMDRKRAASVSFPWAAYIRLTLS